jgi:hypothetical protein
MISARAVAGQTTDQTNTARAEMMIRERPFIDGLTNRSVHDTGVVL